MVHETTTEGDDEGEKVEAVIHETAAEEDDGGKKGEEVPMVYGVLPVPPKQSLIEEPSSGEEVGKTRSTKNKSNRADALHSHSEQLRDKAVKPRSKSDVPRRHSEPPHAHSQKHDSHSDKPRRHSDVPSVPVLQSEPQDEETGNAVPPFLEVEDTGTTPEQSIPHKHHHHHHHHGESKASDAGSNKRKCLRTAILALLLNGVIVGIVVPVVLRFRPKQSTTTTQTEASQECTGYIDRYSSCLATELSVDQAESCALCMRDSISVSVPGCAEMQQLVCETQCECGACTGEIEQYLVCEASVQFPDCNIECQGSSTSSPQQDDTCGQKLSDYHNCLTEELSAEQHKSCTDCFTEPFGETYYSCEDMEASVCNALQQCYCGSCVDTIQAYLDCEAYESTECHIEC